MQETQVRSLGWEDSSGEGNGNPLQYSLSRKSCGQRSLAGYSPRGHKRVRRDLATKQTTINYTMKWILTSVFSNRIFIPFAMSISQWSLGTRVTFLFSIPNVPSGSSSWISQSSISPRKHVFFIRFLIFLPLHFRVLPFRVALNFPSLAHYSIQCADPCAPILVGAALTS